MSAKILLVEDEVIWSKLVKKILEAKGYLVTVSSNSDEAMQAISLNAPDLFILDVNLGGVSGLQLCQLLRSNPQTANTPVLMLTGMKNESDKVRGLENGADDYLVKPFGSDELAARVFALLRRSGRVQQQAPNVLRTGPIAIDLDRHEATVDGLTLDLRPKEFNLLALLMEKKGKALNKEFIAEAFWGKNYDVTSQSIVQQVKNLRAKLGAHGDCIETIDKLGYRMRDVPPNT
jgi:DNA-binding response OmpR family regulator